MTYVLRMSLGLIVLACCACSKSEAIDEQLLKTYTDYVVLRMAATDTTTSQHRLDSLLTAQGYTKDRFFAELSEYGSNPERMRVFYDSVRSRIGRMQAEISR